MSDYNYTVTSTATGEYQPPSNPLSQVTEQQIQENYCFIVSPDDEVVFFKNAEMWSEAKKILEGYHYQVFYCFEVLKKFRMNKVPNGTGKFIALDNKILK
jgi:hypothetical protein